MTTKTTTARIVAAGGGLQPLGELIRGRAPVSSTSTFDEDVWFIDLPAHKGGRCRIDFRIVEEPLRSRGKALLWATMATPRRAHRADLASVVAIAPSVIRLLTWLETRCVHDFADCDAWMPEEHLEDLARWLEQQAEELEDAGLNAKEGEGAGDVVSGARAVSNARTKARAFRGQACRAWTPFDPEAEGAVGEARSAAGLDGSASGWAPAVIGTRSLSYPSLGRNGHISRGAPAGVFDAWARLHRHGPDLARMGVAPMTEMPFGGELREHFLRKWSALYSNAVSALPDPVFVAAARGAERMIGTPADDVVALVERVTGGIANGLTLFESLRRCQDHPFAVVEGETRPWSDRFTQAPTDPTRAIAFFSLIRLVRDAADTLLFAHGGMRPSEVIVAEGGVRPHERPRTLPERTRTRHAAEVESGCVLPVALRESLSHSGLTVAFHFASWVVKGRKDWRPATWLIGGMTDGGSVPPAVRATIVLERLFAPLRRFACEGSTRLQLAVRFDPNEPVPDELVMQPLCTRALCTSLKQSLFEFCDFSGLPDEWHGIDLRRYRSRPSISAYQFRKAWAQAVYRMEPRLKSAIARQLKHVKVAVTEQFYITDDPVLRRHLDGMAVRQSNQLFERLIDGEVKVAGGMAPLIEREMEKVRARLGDVTGLERQQAIAQQAALQQAKVFFFSDAHCFIGLRPRASLCNRFGRGAHWARQAPDTSVRDRNLCADCPCALFSPEHAPALLRSYVADRRAWLEAEAAGLADWHLISRARAGRDARLLSQMGVRIPTDAEVMDG
ncbi:hypothetical protein [Sphingomonas sp.]|jgi:hypothetical protein|uniref:hypothetical protein n=1 Tax=Sphingomonas sp. TaxID=28214 RepID=UPI002DF2510D|nr:hypothetical protein [Sphingomonas sp.]